MKDKDKVQFLTKKVINLHHMFTIGMDEICTNKTYKYIFDVYNVVIDNLFLILNFKSSLVCISTAQFSLSLTLVNI